MAAGSEGVIGSVGAFLSVHEAIRDLRRQADRIVFFALALIMVAVAVGVFIMQFPRAALQEVTEEFDMEIAAGIDGRR